MWKTIGSFILSSVVPTILNEKITTGLSIVLIRLGLSKKADISVIWKATFEIGKAGKKTEYVEIIKVENKSGSVIGKIHPHADNYEALKVCMNRCPL